MKKYIPYAIAALVGFHLRWLVSTANGWSYSMNGMDIMMAATCIIMVWSFRGLLRRKKPAPERALGSGKDNNSLSQWYCITERDLSR